MLKLQSVVLPFTSVEVKVTFDTPIGKLRGKVHRFGETNLPLVVTYHPAYLLRSPAQKRKSWEDLKLAMAVT